MEKGRLLATKSISVAILAFVLSYGIMISLDPINFPICTVTFKGEQRALSWEGLQDSIVNELSPGFIRLKVSHIQQTLLMLPWIKQVDIRKEWPNKLVIGFEEHTPAVKWDETGIISAQGVLFYPEGGTKQWERLPHLVGPIARYSVIWKHYLAMTAILQPYNLSISELVFAPRGSWHLQLSNGMTVHLGTDDTLKRLKRFVRIYKTHIESKERTVTYVDLRYTRGIAVGWKSG